MALTKEETNKYMRWLYQFLKAGHEFEFGKSNLYRGWIHDEREDGVFEARVFLDPRHKLLSTLIHEFLHFQHPDWCESKVLQMESQIVNSISDRQVRNLVKRFAEAL